MRKSMQKIVKLNFIAQHSNSGLKMENQFTNKCGYKWLYDYT